MHCSGANSCELTTAICPVDYSCALSCDQDNACLNAYLQCDNKGPCVLDCKNGVDPCANATVNCGTGSCGAFCSNPASAKPSVQCGNACECNSC